MTKKKTFVTIVFGLLVLFGLHLTSLHSYLLFHSIVEIFSIVVACGIFMLAWNARRFLENTYLLFLGIAYLFVGGLDLIHTLAYTGMGVFEGYGTNLPTQLWIAARYMESLSLLIAPFLLGRKLKVNAVFLGYVLVTSLLLASIFYWDLFPTCFIEKTGLTPFKKISEYVISLILLASIAILLEKRRDLDVSILRLLIASIALTIVSELAFTLYAHAYGLANMIGHYLKIVSFYLIYKAIIETGLARPYALLFKNLKESEERFRQLSESVRDAFWLRTAGDGGRGEIIYVNPAFEEIFGLKAEEIYKSDNAWLEILHGDDRVRVLGALEEFVRGRGEYDVEYRIVRDQGAVRWIWAKGFPIRDEKGNIVRTAGIVQDITQRKRAESLIVQAKQEWERTFDAVPDLIMILDNEYRVLRTNKSMAERLGCTPKDLVGRICYDAFHGTEKPVTPCPHARLMADGLAHSAEVHEDRLGGDFLVSVNPLYDLDGKLKGSVHVARDITERKQAEEALRVKTHALSERVKKLNCLYGISHLLEKKRISIEEIFKGTVNLIPPSWQHPEATCARINVEGREFTTENFQETRWKQKSDIIVNGHQIGSLEVYYLSEKPESDEGPFLEEERSLIGAIAERLGRITERVRAQEALKKAHHELELRVEERTSELAEANKLLKQEIEERKRAEAALRESENELRNLSAQLFSAQENERKAVAQDLHDSIGQTLAAIKFGTEDVLRQLPKRASKTIRQPLEATISIIQNAIEEVRRIQTDLRPPTLDDLGILATISWFCREFQTIYSGIRIERHIELREDDVPDPLKTIIYRVMQEALSNVAKHSKANLVRISMRKANGRIELAVEDNGLGFDLEDVLSLENAKRGIGVSSMKERAELSGGSFAIESATGAGTIIRASWPEN